MVTPKPKGAAKGPERSSKDGLAPKDRLALRPIARVTRIALIEREVRERLSRAALELLFSHAEVMSEGQRSTRAGAPIYFGSTMLTVDLETLAPFLREPCDAGTARRLGALLARDPTVATRVKAIAAKEAARLAGGRLRAVAAEMKVTARGSRVFIDVDVEATP
jgi:hypothetical protein